MPHLIQSPPPFNQFEPALSSWPGLPLWCWWCFMDYVLSSSNFPIQCFLVKPIQHDSWILHEFKMRMPSLFFFLSSSSLRFFCLASLINQPPKGKIGQLMITEESTMLDPVTQNWIPIPFNFLFRVLILPPCNLASNFIPHGSRTASRTPKKEEYQEWPQPSYLSTR